jgi:cytoskeletal protein CcmA (bactofilin family)
VPWAPFDRKRQESGEWTGFLEQGVRVEGKLEAPGTFRIDAHVKGKVVSQETLIIGEHASVEGEIAGNAVIIGGRFDGTIQARGRVEIRTKAVVKGDIQTPCLVIDAGAIFDGRCIVPVGKESPKLLTIPVHSVSPHS